MCYTRPRSLPRTRLFNITPYALPTLLELVTYDIRIHGSRAFHTVRRRCVCKICCSLDTWSRLPWIAKKRSGQSRWTHMVPISCSCSLSLSIRAVPSRSNRYRYAHRDTLLFERKSPLYHLSLSPPRYTQQQNTKQ